MEGFEIAELLRTIPAQLPSIPSRIYPQPLPSTLPALLGLKRLLLSRIARTSLARHALRSHHHSRLRRLTVSVAAFKESQAKCLLILPRSSSLKELPCYAQCKSVSDAVAIAGEKGSIPPLTILRCGIMDYGKGKEDQHVKPSTKDLYRYLESQIPWLVSEKGLRYESKTAKAVGHTSICPLFNNFPQVSNDLHNNADADLSATHWKYIPPTPESPIPWTKSLNALLYELPEDIKTRTSLFQRTLQSLSDFTREITAQVHLPYRPPTMGAGIPSLADKFSTEDELRREIRALKGLVLNRRSFIPSIPRPIVQLV